jgi:uncharacterized repeat protein (TIGR03847 family)
MEKQHNYGEVNLLSPVAVGTPGKRTFFLAVSREENWLRIWLEKQDLQALALGIRQLLISLPKDVLFSYPNVGTSATQMSAGLPEAEYDLFELELSWQDNQVILNITVEVSGHRKQGQSALHLKPTVAKLKQFGEEAEQICAAGRPTCPLCGGPIDPTGHICPSRN